MSICANIDNYGNLSGKSLLMENDMPKWEYNETSYNHVLLYNVHTFTYANLLQLGYTTTKKLYLFSHQLFYNSELTSFLTK